MFHVKHLTQSPQYTQPYLYTITITTRGQKGFTPETQNTQHTGKRGFTRGHAPEPILERKKTISFSFSSIILSPTKGVSRGRILPLGRNRNKKYLPVSPSVLFASPCLCLLLSSLYLIVSVAFSQPTQPPTYTIQPPSNTTSTQCNLYNKYTTTNLHNHQPIHNTTSKGQSTPPKLSSIPFHSFWFHELMK